MKTIHHIIINAIAVAATINLSACALILDENRNPKPEAIKYTKKISIVTMHTSNGANVDRVGMLSSAVTGDGVIADPANYN